MPIFSAAGGTQFPEDNRYMPVTEIQPVDAPEYAFYFYPEDGFRSKYFFDDCRHFYSFKRDLKYQKVDFNHQDLYYRRLFALRNLPQRPKFYLCPWLIVPFEEVTTSTSTTYEAKPNQIQLWVKPYSIYEGKNSKRIKDRILRNNPDPTNGRTLELFSSGNGINASWANPKAGSPSNIIDELDCRKNQKIIVTIDSKAAKYDHSAYVEIRAVVGTGASSFVTVGRVYFVFLEMVSRNVIFFDVQEIPNSQSKLQIRILGSPGGTQSAELDSKLADLNTVYKMAGLTFKAPPVSIALKDASTAFVTGSTITFDTGLQLNMTDASQGPEIARIFNKKITAINGSPWNENINDYLFVFVMAISPPISSFAGDSLKVGQAKGITRVGVRAACVFDYGRKTLAHESAHALGISHNFYDGKVKDFEISRNAEDSATDLKLSTTEDLYLFYDNVNSKGLDSTITDILGQITPLMRLLRADGLRNLLHTRLYYIYGTDNLLDYQNESKMPEEQEQLRRDQIEMIRFSV